MDSWELAMALLDDEHGINDKAWAILRKELEDCGDTDILNKVKADNGRWYLYSCDASAIHANHAKEIAKQKKLQSRGL